MGDDREIADMGEIGHDIGFSGALKPARNIGCPPAWRKRPAGSRAPVDKLPQPDFRMIAVFSRRYLRVYPEDVQHKGPARK
jgi:hypothetical protein